MARLVAPGGLRGPDIDPRVSTWRPGADAVTLTVPLVVPVGMRVLFGVLTRRLGVRRGYLAGFACYWAGCYLLPPVLLGRRRVRALLRERAGPLPGPRWLAAMALLVPPVGAVGTQLLPGLGQADPAQLATAAALAAVNATGEELLWRGLFVASFPGDPIRGWLWPALGFTAWHLAPLSVRPARQPGAFLSGAAMIGAGMGWIAWRTGSLRWTLPAHLATDANGLSAARLWLGRSD